MTHKKLPSTALRIFSACLIPFIGLLLLRFYFGQPPSYDDMPSQVPSSIPKVVTIANTIQPVTEPSATSPPRLPDVPDTTTATTTTTVQPTEAPAAPSLSPRIIISAESGLNVREGAGTSYPVARVAPNGEQVQLSGARTNVEGFPWVELSEGGWVQEQYLRQE